MTENATESADLPTDWWTTQDVLRYLESIGRKISRGTWTTYVSRGLAPSPGKRYGNMPLWSPAVVREWQKNRPGSGRPPRAA